LPCSIQEWQCEYQMVSKGSYKRFTRTGTWSQCKITYEGLQLGRVLLRRTSSQISVRGTSSSYGCRLFVSKLGRFVATTVTLYEIRALILRETMVMYFKLFRVQNHHSFIEIEPASFLLEPKPMLATRCMEISRVLFWTYSH